MDVASAPGKDQETTDHEALHMLHELCHNGFDGSISACALALGRESEEIGDMMHEQAAIDEDLVMKIRGIASERGIDIGLREE